MTLFYIRFVKVLKDHMVKKKFGDYRTEYLGVLRYESSGGKMSNILCVYRESSSVLSLHHLFI